MLEIIVTKTVEYIAHLTDENHIWINDIGNIVFEENNPMNIFCTQCFFNNYNCDNIPCTPTTRQDGKNGIWVKVKEELK